MRLKRERGLAGRRNKDGSITFVCDDCGLKHTISSSPNRYGFQVVSPQSISGPWSVTQRKQRCPDCTVIAREKGWVK